ncbi:DNA cytosine methyltransferase [Pseudomonas oryzihabitans]|uniref:DNA cytosine methyltransferase n=1 Tax=Pseudomonas oryzihabitans TaxID=47885 RepID=UPI00214E895C|nr:DNA cytosine methyltransferase [Pseudomonas psychrotolerans]UUW74415.1 DNA cytosine methyltransferase [Pseudomonas psychrotolerans]UUW74467.1 DNA cytosine methyltransferase [Pseudomonas psychrotolerans]
MLTRYVLKHFHFCCGIGGGAKGFNQNREVVGHLQADWRCIGGVDVDPGALRDFGRIAGVPGTQMDLFTREQYTDFHGKEPPAEWREATPADIRRAAGFQDPDVVFISSPCKGASGLLSETLSQTPKYQALNELTLRCVWLMCEAWQHNPVSLIVFENVPRLATRGRHLLDQIAQVLSFFGYAVNETTHDCGELGGLAQRRKRFLLVARHVEKVPPFLYEPEKRTLQSVGSLLGRMPLPGDIERAGPMHRIPALQWKTWVRLALVEAGKDWRSLDQLAVEDGHLRDFVIVPEAYSGYLGVRGWEDFVGTIAGQTGPTNGAFSVADPRSPANAAQYQQYGVRRWSDPTGAIIGIKSPGQGTFSVADPRGAAGGHGKYNVTRWTGSARTVIAGSTTGQGAFAVQDPRTGLRRVKGDAYLTGGHYGVVPWDGTAGAVSARARLDNGRWSVADPRMPAASDRLTCVIRSLDGTWHRPFTTLEKAALQSLVDPEEQLELDGLSDQAWCERIGNAVPPKAAEAIAGVMAQTLLLSKQGETFLLSSTPVWVRPIAVSLSLASPIENVA